MTETWKDIDNYPLYQISNLGRVRSLSRNVNTKSGSVRFHKGRILKNQDNRGGYLYVNIYNNSGMKKFNIHRLVAVGFIKRVNGKLYVNHKDGNKKNNRVDNLEWCNVSENTKHAYDNKLITPLFGSKQNGAKLKEDQVLQIKLMGITTYKECKIIGRMYGVSQSTIYDIIKGKTWKQIKIEK